MGALMWIIVLIIIISSIVRNSAAGKSKRKPGGANAPQAKPDRETSYAKRAEPNRQPFDAKPNQAKSGTRTAKPNKPKPGMKMAKPNQSKPGAKAAKPNKPKPGTKTATPNQPKPDRAQVMRQTAAGDADRERYVSYKQARQQGQSPASAMRQTHVDDILNSARENNRAVEQDNDLDTIEIGDLMAKVQENIVKGPADTLPFQRDFVAEGTDFLNRCLTIPGT